MIHNAAIAELLICEGKASEGHREQAYRCAAHEAFMWPEEATTIVAAGRSLQELTGIGPSLAKRLHGWIVSPATFELPVYSESCDVEKLGRDRGRRDQGGGNLVASNQVYRGVRQTSGL